MKSLVLFTALAAGTTALVSRGGSCCFHLFASGGASGEVRQLSDGQNRIGDNSLPIGDFCINKSGGITDSHGRGCILTRKSNLTYTSMKSWMLTTSFQHQPPSFNVTRGPLPLPASLLPRLVFWSIMVARTSLPARPETMVV